SVSCAPADAPPLGGFASPAAAAGDAVLIAGALGTRGRVETALAAVGIGAALRVDGLIRTGERARSPATVGIDVLVGRAGDPGAGIVVAGVRRAAAVTPRRAAACVTARARVVSGPGTRAAVGAVDCRAVRPGAVVRIVVS